MLKPLSWIVVLAFPLFFAGCNKPSQLGQKCNSFRGCAEGVCTLISIRHERPRRLCTLACKSDRLCKKRGMVCYRMQNVKKPLKNGFCVVGRGREIGASCTFGAICDHGICTTGVASCQGRDGCYCTQQCEKHSDCLSGWSCGASEPGIKVCKRPESTSKQPGSTSKPSKSTSKPSKSTSKPSR